MTADYSKVPQAMKALKRWCVYRLVSSGKPDRKRPGKKRSLINGPFSLYIQNTVVTLRIPIIGLRSIRLLPASTS